MPPKTAKMQRLFGAAYAVKEGKSKGFPEARKVAGQMTKAQLKEFATKPKGGYPGKAKKKK